MLVRVMCAALAFLITASFTTTTAFATAEEGGRKQGVEADQIAAISKEAFEEMLSTSVEEEGSVKLEQGNTLRVELAAEEKVLFFTRPGHPAHPAVVEVKIVEGDGHPSLDTSGWWAGDAEAYRHWYHAFKRRNARLSRQWQQESGPF